MPATVNVHEVKTHLSNLLDRAHAGEEITIAEAGKPYARLVRIEDRCEPVQRQPSGWPERASIPGSVWFEPLPEGELALREGRAGDLL